MKNVTFYTRLETEMTEYPGDKYACEHLTKYFVDKLRKGDNQSDDMSFFNSCPRVPVSVWKFEIPIWKNGKIVSTNDGLDSKREIELANYALANFIDRRHYIDNTKLSNSNENRDLEKTTIAYQLAPNEISGQRTIYYNTLLVTEAFDTCYPDSEWEINSYENYYDFKFQSNPRADINRWCRNIEKKTGRFPNYALISEEVYKFLCRYFKCNNRDGLALKLKLEKIFTIGWIFDEKSEKFKDCNAFLLYYAPKEVFREEYYSGDMTMTAIARFTWKNFKFGDNEFNTRIMRYEEPRRRSVVLDQDTVFKLEVVSKDLGLLYKPKRYENE